MNDLHQPRPASTIATVVCLAALLLPGPVQASEILLKISHQDAARMAACRGRGEFPGAVDNQTCGAAINALLAGTPYEQPAPGPGQVPPEALHTIALQPADPLHFIPSPDSRAVIGRQEPARPGAWDKYILSPAPEGLERFFLTSSPGPGVVSQVVTKNADGTWMPWHIDEPPRFAARTNQLYRVSRQYFDRQLSRPRPQEWLEAIMPATDGIALLVVNEPTPDGGTADRLLIRIDCTALPPSPNFPVAALVVGWKPPSPEPRSEPAPVPKPDPAPDQGWFFFR